MYPTVDHIESGGEDADSNWVTASMMRNLKKSNVPLVAHGWTLRPAHRDTAWDGLLGWYLRYLTKHAELRRVNYLRDWYRAGLAATAA
jgi:hypothetical protein